MEPAGPDAGSLRAAAPLVIAGFAISFVLVGGGIDTVSIFINAIAQTTDWARSGLSAGVAVGAVVAALATPAVGVAVDRHGVRVPMLIGVVLLAVGFGILVAMQAPWHFVAANVFLGGGFAACALLPITVTITVVVRDRRALALGIAAAGASAGALVLAPALQAVVEALGWRGSYAVLGAAVVLTPLPFLAFVLPRGRIERTAESDGLQPALPSLRELSQPGMRGLMALMVLPGLVTFAISVHLVPYLTGSGLSGGSAALALGATIGVSAIGKVAGGGLADRFGSLQMMRVALLLGTGAVALLPTATTALSLAGFVALYGLALGTTVAVMPALAREILGEARFGTLFGVLQLIAMLAAAVGPVAAGAFFDATGRYTAAIGVWVGAFACALLVALAMRCPAAVVPPDAVARPGAV